MKPFVRRLLFVPAAALGVAALAIAIQTRKPPAQTSFGETAVAARYIEAPKLSVVPRVVGYGTAAPARVWDAVAQVSGEVVEVHPQLKRGSLLAAGTLLLRIDPTDYELTVAQIEADIQAVEAEMAELQTRHDNTRESLAIEEKGLELARRDLERKRQLLGSRTVSQATVDAEERSVLARVQAVQTQRNALNLIPAERRVLQARIAQLRSKLEAARLDLERTAVAAPFDCRLAEVRVEAAQFVAKGQVMVQADSIDVAEVTAQVPIDKMLKLVPQGVPVPREAAQMMGRLQEILGLSAVVRLRGGDATAEWPARFVRISDTIDPQTRTVGVIVEVDEPYRETVLGVRPPLAKNMFVEVELAGVPRPEEVVIPRSALRGATVHLVTADGRLERRPVEIGLSQANFVTIRKGIAEGERVVVSDLVPAIEGMRLDPSSDEATAQALLREASGEGSVR